MSEQQQKPKSFMQELDEWCEVTIIKPLIDPMLEFDIVEEQVKKAIRAKVLESYKNGLKAKDQPVRRVAR